MGKLYDKLAEDIRLHEGLTACINCGTCTAICAAAEFYDYDPRQIADMVQTQDDLIIEALLKSDAIWYCGECMSCKTRCPRGNAPGLIIMALRALSQDMGYFTESEKGRQQIYVKRTVGDWILDHGYCLYMEGVSWESHPEQGPVWGWIQEHWNDVFARLGANYKGNGPGILRKIPDDVLAEIKKIYDVTGGTDRQNNIEKFSRKKAEEMGMKLDEKGVGSEYVQYVYNANHNKHNAK